MFDSQSNSVRNLINSSSLDPAQKDTLLTWYSFLRHQGRSPKTALEYALDVRGFLLWLPTTGRNENPKTVGSLTAQDYRDHLVEQYRPATVGRALCALRGFYTWLGMEQVFARTKVQAITEVSTAPRSLTQEEWRRLDRAAEERSEQDGFLAVSVLRLMRFAGLRVGEVCALELPDLDCGRRKGSVRIRRGKGLKSREVPLGFEICDVLGEYLEKRRELADKWRTKAAMQGKKVPEWSEWPTGRVILSLRGVYTPSGLYRLVESVGQKAKVEVHPHMLRHTFAKALIDPERYGTTRPPVPLSALRQLLGHASLETTGAYLLHSQEDLEEIMAGR